MPKSGGLKHPSKQPPCSVPDPVATADKEAVTQAVRTNGGKALKGDSRLETKPPHIIDVESREAYKKLDLHNPEDLDGDRLAGQQERLH
jgi:hypothetical protein